MTEVMKIGDAETWKECESLMSKLKSRQPFLDRAAEMVMFSLPGVRLPSELDDDDIIDDDDIMFDIWRAVCVWGDPEELIWVSGNSCAQASKPGSKNPVQTITTGESLVLVSSPLLVTSSTPTGIKAAS